MTWVKTQGVFTNKPWHKSWLLSKSRSESRCRSARWWLAPRLSSEYHNRTDICFTNTRNYCHRNTQNLCVDKSSQTNIFTIGWVCSNILYCEHSVSFLLSPSRIHVQAHPWTAMWRLWVRDDVTIVAIDFEWKNVTQTKQRRDMRLTAWLTSWLNRVSMIFLCEYDLTWTRTESQVRLGPGPSQVLSQVSSQDC